MIIMRTVVDASGRFPAWICEWRGEWATSQSVEEAKKFATITDAIIWATEHNCPPHCFYKFTLEKIE